MSTLFDIPGYKFNPTVEEIFRLFLKPKICGGKLPRDHRITDVDLYASHPCELFKDMAMSEDLEEERTRYVFTALKKVSKAKKGRNNLRRIPGVGTWEGERPDELKDEHGTVIAYDRYFKFVPEPKKEDSLVDGNNSISMVEGEWRMHEYSFHPDFLQQLQVERDLVLCRITMKVKGNSRAKNKRGCRGVIYVREPPASCNVMMQPPQSNDNVFTAAAAVQEIERPYDQSINSTNATTEPPLSYNNVMMQLPQSNDYVFTNAAAAAEQEIKQPYDQGIRGNNATTDVESFVPTYFDIFGEDMEVLDKVDESASSSDHLSCNATTTTMEDVGESMEVVDNGKSLDIVVDDTMKGGDGNNATTDVESFVPTFLDIFGYSSDVENMGEDTEVHDNVDETAASTDLSCNAATSTVEEVGERMDIVVDDTMEGDQRNCDTICSTDLCGNSTTTSMKYLCEPLQVPEDNILDIDFGFLDIEFTIDVDEFLRDV